MTGLTIIGVKVVGICSKCRKEGDEIQRNKDGSIIPDKEISCINAALGDSPCQKIGRDSQSLTHEQLEKNEEKRVKCIYCKQPIHVTKFGGIKKEGLFCNETLCIMQLIREHKDDNCTKDEVKG